MILAERGQHRAASIPHLLGAATAELGQLTVLHLDKDFELIAQITRATSRADPPAERIKVRPSVFALWFPQPRTGATTAEILGSPCRPHGMGKIGSNPERLERTPRPEAPRCRECPTLRFRRRVTVAARDGIDNASAQAARTIM